MISEFIELTANRFGRNWTIQILIQLNSHIGGSRPVLSLHNAFQCICLCRYVWKSGRNYSGYWRVFRAS